jgi:hypothetical protein
MPREWGFSDLNLKKSNYELRITNNYELRITNYELELDCPGFGEFI